MELYQLANRLVVTAIRTRAIFYITCYRRVFGKKKIYVYAERGEQRGLTSDGNTN